ncbi:GNAT family N-acetyltransferase [Vibrio sp. RC27]
MTAGHVYLTDGNVIVRDARLDDASRISSYFITNRDHLKPWEPEREGVFYSPASWSQRLIKLAELHKIGLGFYLLVFVDNKMVGTISFSQLVRFPVYSCNVGYSLAAAAVGKGIMTAALKLACEYMFEEQHMHRINAAYMPRNKRSSNVLHCNGFVEEGFAKEYLLINGKWEDHNLTALINPNWKPNEE